jgi:XTP/dITP diphosphohydrolase
MKLVLATRNEKKLVELRRILAPLVAAEVIGLGDVPAYEEVPETGATFADNALLKAREAVRHTGLPAVADDSGLAVDALNGMPGVLSARWAGPGKDDAANNALLLAQLNDVPDERRGAAFVAAVAFCRPDGTEDLVSGDMPGVVIREQRGDGGFGYDPLFVPAGYDVTSAELPAEEKDKLSHRGKALRAIAPLVAETLA